MGLFKLVKNHPKKSLFAVAAASYLLNYANEKYSENVLRRRFCDSVKPKGLELVPPTVQLRRITVFLNPFARHGSLLKEFEKNVAPLLQLSGLDVQMVYTDNDFETKDFVRVLDPQSTDGILVASDDHVLQKVVTALLERPELTAGPRLIPVGIVPVGVWNTFASTVTGPRDQPSWCFQMLNPLLNGTVQMQNVLEITAVPNSSDHSQIDNQQAAEESQPTESSPKQVAFSLSGLEWSMWRDAEHGGGIGAPKNKSKPTDPNDHRGLLPPLSPWSFRPWTRRFGAMWRYTWFWLRSTPEVNNTLMLTAVPDSNPSFFRVNAEIPPTQSAQPVVHRRIRSKYGQLVYTPACDGCSKCWPDRIKHLQSSADLGVSASPKSESTFSRMFGLSRAKSIGSGLSNQMHQKRLPADRSHIQNEECGREYTMDLRDTAGVVMTLDGENVRVQIIPTPKGFFSYMRETFSWLRSDSYRANLIDEPQSLCCATVRLYPQITQNEFYWIDNDHFEACPVEVRVRINAIDFYRESNQPTVG